MAVLLLMRRKSILLSGRCILVTCDFYDFKSSKIIFSDPSLYKVTPPTEKKEFKPSEDDENDVTPAKTVIDEVTNEKRTEL